MPTLKDVADLAKVSLTTASHALNGKKVNEETRQRVIDAAKKLHYYVNVSGRNLITRRTNSICITIINSSRDNDMFEELSHYYPVIIGVINYAQSKGFTVRVETVLWDDITQNEYFEQKVYGRADDGIIIIPQYKNRCDFVKLFDDQKYPYVFINPWHEMQDRNVVILNNYAAGIIAASTIAENRHKRILFINGPGEQIAPTYLERGFLDGLLQHGVRFNKSDIIYTDLTHEGGYYAMKKVLSDSEINPSFVFCANDYIATGVMSALHEAGKNIPKDISVMGCDGREASKYVFPRLTTIDQDTVRVGFEAAKRLIELVNDPVQEKQFESVILWPKLVMRNTIAKV